MSTLREEALKMHKEKRGKLGVHSKVAVNNANDLSLAYSPGVAEPCLDIHEDESKVFDYTMKGNLVAVVSNGTAVLGLGNIGPKAAMPVMEGKALLFKSFADVDAFPICLDTMDPDKIIEVVKLLQPTFGGVNLEDIAAPQCFEIEDRLRKMCDIPIFHDDQHGTAIVTAAGLINALKLTDKNIQDIRVVANGAGAAGVAIVKLLLHMGVKDVILCDTNGIIYEGRPVGMNPFKEEMARITNKEQKQGTLADALVGADVFVGVSAAGSVTKEMVRSMNHLPIIFAMANPVPEIMPEDAKEAGALVVGTGRSDFPNQVNNVLAFPGIFRGALDVQAKEINEEMKLAAVHAIAGLISDDELYPDYVIPDPFDRRVAAHVAAAVAKTAMDTGVAQNNVNVEEIKMRLLTLVEEKQPVLL
ncbi:malate dehydrogenase (oxaloacetate-decarboxylating) [Neobacillus bataviensis]|uniref:Malate dehydrogenase (Oxaloacetate-decarboxylating) n=1 Tax=Neobacillus bataviensis TaxID=220685 RepID=A0A561CAS3_9BACI|nr:malic enzyme-like NAD(P)-binding protein [Neobacillus bataviensis]TWD88293.1 malate dehydrogenase (oxaloacetate-decarboxylating) [Neobacillus bataviensis]